MIKDKRLNVFANCVVNEKIIANFIAMIDLEKMETSFSHRYIDKEACKSNREMVRDEQSKFEDFAYSIQDTIMK